MLNENTDSSASQAEQSKPIVRRSNIKPLLEELRALNTEEVIIKKIYAIVDPQSDAIAPASASIEAAIKRGKEEILNEVKLQVVDSVNDKQMQLIEALVNTMLEENFRGRLVNLIGTQMQ